MSLPGVTESSFKNVYISDGGMGITLYERTPGGGMGSRLDTFKHEEYDVTVSFKRKPRSVVANDRVYVEGELGGPYRVLASLYSGVNAWAWLIRDSASYVEPRTVSVSRLRLADDSV